jgi:hypothetical protein
MTQIFFGATKKQLLNNHVFTTTKTNVTQQWRTYKVGDKQQRNIFDPLPE